MASIFKDLIIRFCYDSSLLTKITYTSIIRRQNKGTHCSWSLVLLCRNTRNNISWKDHWHSFWGSRKVFWGLSSKRPNSSCIIRFYFSMPIKIVLVKKTATRNLQKGVLYLQCNVTLHLVGKTIGALQNLGFECKIGVFIWKLKYFCQWSEERWV